MIVGKLKALKKSVKIFTNVKGNMDYDKGSRKKNFFSSGKRTFEDFFLS